MSNKANWIKFSRHKDYKECLKNFNLNYKSVRNSSIIKSIRRKHTKIWRRDNKLAVEPKFISTTEQWLM